MTSTARRVALTAHADAELVALGAELADVDARALPAVAGGDALYEPLYEESWRLRERINRIPATTIAGLKVKARAAEIALAGDVDASNKGDGSFVDLARSLGRDVLALSCA